MDIEQKIKTKLLIRGFSKDTLLNNRGLIRATTDETILEVVKNIGVTRCCETFKEEQRRPSSNVEKWMIEHGYKICD